MNKNYLLLTIGHNSSAIFFNPDTNKVIGYEQERLSGIKCDSQFPIDAINEIRHYVPTSELKDCRIKISHWLDFENDYEFKPNKYMTDVDYQYLKEISDDIEFCSKEFTHHDAHANSVLSFFKYHLAKEGKTYSGKLHTIVFDGFGNNEEAITICELDENGTQKIIFKVNNYYASMGLLYQYATSFVGMKENQDEYKFLGYEAHIDEEFSENDINIIKSFADKIYHYYYATIFSDKRIEKDHNYGTVIDFNILNAVRDTIYTKLQEVADFFNLDVKTDEYKFRILIGYIVQNVVERIAGCFIEKFNIENLLVCGGTFYNVKLNNYCLQHINGLFSVVPLAGDQGTSIGFVERDGIQFNWEKLTIGPRRFYDVEKIIGKRKTVRYIELNNEDDLKNAANEIAQKISDNNLVNVVQNNVEFGPRALCSTTTMMLPSEENAEENNFLNGRDTCMPFAPMIRIENSDYFFDKNELERVIGSDKFMICTHDYKSKYSKMYAGMMHKKTLIDNVYTGRPQFVFDKNCLEWNILKDVEDICGYKANINTSFNPHSWPILFNIMHILHGFDYQYEHAHENKKPWLYIINKKY